MKWELLIEIKDKPELVGIMYPQHSKKGDIIAVKPYPWEWGEIEKRNYLVVVVDGIEADEAKKLQKPLFDKEDFDPALEKPIMMAKRKFNIDFNKLKSMETIDEEQLLDPNVVYQPLKNKTLVIAEDGEDLIYDKKIKKFKKLKNG
jgi:hypothetical protein